MKKPKNKTKNKTKTKKVTLVNEQGNAITVPYKKAVDILKKIQNNT